MNLRSGFTFGESADWNLTPEVTIYMEAVHGLSDLGAVVTRAPDGFKDDRCELFDEAGIDTALARFDDFSRRP